jgi:TRAP-type C4-dicarboxylate transport system permease small subunit
MNQTDKRSLRGAILWLCRAAEWLAIAALFAVTGLIALQIVAREVFVAGIAWADELARYAGLTLIFLGIPMLLARNEHVKVDMFLMMLPERPRRWVAVANEVLMAAFALLFLVAGWLFMERAAKFATPAMAMPNLLFYMPAFVGMALMLLVAIERTWTVLTRGEETPAP